MADTNVDQSRDRITKEQGIRVIVKAMHRLPQELLPEVYRYIQFLEYKIMASPDAFTEDASMWAEVRANTKRARQSIHEKAERMKSDQEFLDAMNE